VNDYHLMLVPGMVREALPYATIGFYLHAPFPSSEIFRCLPVRKELLEGVAGANMIGFQVRACVRAGHGHGRERDVSAAPPAHSAAAAAWWPA